MWEFLGGLSETAGGGAAGVLAVVLILVLVGFGIAAKYAWTFARDQSTEIAQLRADLKSSEEKHEAEMDTLRAVESSKRAEMRAAFEADRADREEKHAQRMDVSNQARISDMSGLLERVVTHVESTKEMLKKLLQTLEVLISLTRS